MNVNIVNQIRMNILTYMYKIKNESMKKNISLFVFFAIMLLLASCNKDIEQANYTPDVKILFQEGGDSNIVQVGKGVTAYTAKIDVRANGSLISVFEIYAANTRTGNRDTLITETVKSFENAQSAYEVTYTIPQLTQDRCIKVVVTDTLGRVYEKNLVVKITPSVIVSASTKMETVENFYGPYYATWLWGRVYMRKDAAYKNEIDFSLGDIVIASEGADPVPALVNPAARSANNLLTLDGLQQTKFGLTDFTAAQFNAISQVEPIAISSLQDPALDVVRIQNGKVYLFKTANGKKGLIHVSALAQKSATIENAQGNWVPQTRYFEATVVTKTVVP